MKIVHPVGLWVGDVFCYLSCHPHKLIKFVSWIELTIFDYVVFPCCCKPYLKIITFDHIARTVYWWQHCYTLLLLCHIGRTYNSQSFNSLFCWCGEWCSVAQEIHWPYILDSTLCGLFQVNIQLTTLCRFLLLSDVVCDAYVPFVKCLQEWTSIYSRCDDNHHCLMNGYYFNTLDNKTYSWIVNT